MHKSLIGGFKAKDVVNFINEESAKSENEIFSLNREISALKEEIDRLNAENIFLHAAAEGAEKALVKANEESGKALESLSSEFNRERLCLNSRISEQNEKIRQLSRFSENSSSSELKTRLGRVTAERDALAVKLQRAIIERDYATKKVTDES